MQSDLMIASLLTFAVFAVALYHSLDALLTRLLYWQPRSTEGGRDPAGPTGLTTARP